MVSLSCFVPAGGKEHAEFEHGMRLEYHIDVKIDATIVYIFAVRL